MRKNADPYRLVKVMVWLPAAYVEMAQSYGLEPEMQEYVRENLWIWLANRTMEQRRNRRSSEKRVGPVVCPKPRKVRRA